MNVFDSRSTLSPTTRRRFPQQRPNRGAALVVVLSLLLLITILVLAFFIATQTDTQSSTANKQQATLRQLAELPLQIAQAQIRAATTLGQTNSLADSVNTWASQPGLLRVFNNSGSLVRAYKLYSSGVMDTNNVDFIGSEISQTWPAQSNRWINLNEPVRSVMDTNRLTWPILNPGATNWAEGLAISADAAGRTNATMPVEWLYVLANGGIVPQSSLTATNPPVGRIAFWTDDETCKININTAGERTMWDRPWFAHQKWQQFARNQPSTGEYNAYPGHPATMSLSAVFGKALVGSTTNQVIETMLSLSPRYRWGGSENTTKSIWEPRVELDRTKNSTNNKNDRLYATPSEFLLNVPRAIQDTRLTEPLQESGFLITESSRAPEINAFGLPRIAIWPEDRDADRRTVYDNLIAHASTIGSKAYYFQRSSPAARDEAESIPRNWELLQYLDNLTKKETAGFVNSGTSGSFESKWGTDERRQILAEIFDYTRCANLSDTSRDQTDYSKQFTPANQDNRGVVLPTKIAAWNARGFGRVPILSRIGLVFYAVEQTLEPPPPEDPSLKIPAVTKMRCMVWMNFFSPMFGLAPHAMRIKVRLTNFQAAMADGSGGEFTSFQLTGTERNFTFPNARTVYDWGGQEDMIGNYDSGSWTSLVGAGKNIAYEFISQNLVTIHGKNMNFRGGTWTLEIFDQRNGSVPLQTYQLQFPDSTDPWPTPKLYENKPSVELGERGTGPEPTYPKKPGQSPPIARWGIGSPPCDVIRALELRDGDARMVASLENVPTSFFQPGYGYFSSSIMLGGHLLFNRQQILLEDEIATAGNSYSGYGRHVNASLSTSSLGRNFRTPSLPHAVNGQPLNSLRGANWTGDFDNAFINEADGAYLNKPDEGHLMPEPDGVLQPYEHSDTSATFDSIKSKWDPRMNGFFSPTRQMPSPVMFGSLPTGVKRSTDAYAGGKPAEARPWETLLFCPNSLAATVADGSAKIGHPGALSPPDHLLLDLFTMPVVEPYAITEPFSTAGKINLNHRLIPFGHIKRETGLYAALKNLEMVSVPTGGNSSISTPVNIPATLQQMATVLDPAGNKDRGAFRSASEICNVFLVPSNLAAQTLSQYWQARQRTGNNTREAPYNYLYPLLTTKSNTYQVHYRVQTLQPLLQKAGYDPANDFIVTGEQRGSYVLERYLDTNDPRFYGAMPEVNSDTTPLNEFYKFRTLRHNRFTPGR